MRPSDALRELYYRMCFRQIVEMPPEETEAYWCAQAYFELGNIKRCRQLIHQLQAQDASDTFRIAYLDARLSYFENNYAYSAEILRNIKVRNVEESFRLKLLQLVLEDSQNHSPSFAPLASELECEYKLVPLDCQLSWDLFISLRKGTDDDASSQRVQSVMKRSYQAGWTYFAIKSVLALSELKRRQHSFKESQLCLEFALNQLDSQEQHYLYYLTECGLNKLHYGKEQRVRPSDSSSTVVEIANQSIEIDKSPMLRELLVGFERLDEDKTKTQICQLLWPDDTYHPDIHDTRIYDLIKRLRKLLREGNLAFGIRATPHGFRITRKPLT